MKSTGTIVTIVIVTGVNISNRTRRGKRSVKQKKSRPNTTKSSGKKSAETIADTRKMIAVVTGKKGSKGGMGVEISSWPEFSPDTHFYSEPN